MDRSGNVQAAEAAQDTGLPGILDALPEEERRAAIADIMAKAREKGLRGFGGECFHASVAINRVLFGGAGEYVAAFNIFFQEHGHYVGHMAVRHDGVLWDLDGCPKQEDDIESWGMLDPGDGDWVRAASALGAKWDEEKAGEAAIFVFDDGEAEVIETFGDAGIAKMEATLRAAAAEWQAKRSASPAIRR